MGLIGHIPSVYDKHTTDHQPHHTILSSIAAEDLLCDFIRACLDDSECLCPCVLDASRSGPQVRFMGSRCKSVIITVGMLVEALGPSNEGVMRSKDCGNDSKRLMEKLGIFVSEKYCKLLNILLLMSSIVSSVLVT